MTRILAANRHRAILARLDEAETVTVEELAAALAVSRETIRRDLKHLSGQGRLSVVHGGALRGERSEAPFADRRMRNRSAKEAIATLAAGLVGDGMTVLLDSGTTTEAVAEALARSGCARLVLHTTSLANARILGRLPGAKIVLIGGEFDPNDDATTGAEALRSIARISADLAFVGVGGIDESGLVTDYTRAGAAMRSALLKVTARGFLLADHDKFGRRLPSPIATDAASGLLTDMAPSETIRAALAAKGIEITHAM